MLDIVFPEIVHYFVHLYHRNLAKRSMCMLKRENIATFLVTLDIDSF